MKKDERGVSVVEIVIGILILSAVLLSLAASGTLAFQQTYRGRTDMQLWAAVQRQVDSLFGAHWDGLATGSDTVQGYPMTWTVSGTNPKRIDLEVERLNLTTHHAVRDTLIFYVANPNPSPNP